MLNKKFKANRPKAAGSTDITSYWEVIRKIISESDLAIEVLDARMPELSRNQQIEDLIKTYNKKLIFVLNKADLINEKDLDEKFHNLQKIASTFIISGKEKIGTKRLRNYLISKAKKSADFKIGILGYPNTGKSSVINALVKKKKVKVASTAGTTHGQQYIKLTDNILVIDSPGVIPLQKEDIIRHALIGSKNPEKIQDKEIVAHAILKLFKNKEPIEKLYKIQITSNNPEDIINKIGIKRGFLKHKGEINEDKVHILIIRDWQNGKLVLKDTREV